MTDTTFEALLAAQLREFAEAGVRPIDRVAIAEGTIAVGRRRGLSRSRRPVVANGRPLVLVLVAALVLALVVSVAVIGARLLAPQPTIRLPDGFVGELVAAPDLTTPLWQPERVLLDDGRVLLVGGNSGLTTTAQIYDPATGTSVSTGPMVSADAFVPSAAVRLLDGRVLVVGDSRPFDAPFFAVAQVFDPGTGQFDSVGPMVTPRASAKLAVLPDGSVLMTGGTDPNEINTTLASAEIFDPTTSTFRATGSMRTSRAYHAMATLLDGRVLVVGGETATGGGSSRVGAAEIYDPETGEFTDTGRLANPPRWTLAMTLPDGRVAVFESTMDQDQAATNAIWDPATGSFGPTRGLRHRVIDATLLDDGRILLTGVPTRDATWSGIYDPVVETTVDVDAPTGWWPSTIRLRDGRVLVVGGLTDGNVRDPGVLAPAVATVQIFQ